MNAPFPMPAVATAAPNPYFTTEPTLVSFSGGRTSAYMLWCVIQAHGGRLPDHVIVCFANTGREREETLRFVHECEVRWGVRIYWLEYRLDGFAIVDFFSASRNGEPFAALIAKKQYLPNAVTRFCTSELKVRVLKAFALSLGWTHWLNMVGLRHDEMWRVFKQIAVNRAGKERWQTAMPMAVARVTKRHHILPFWLGDNVDPKALTHPLPQGFDLGLRDFEGNCDLCFLKARGKLLRIVRDRPDLLPWWKDQEAATGTRLTASGARFVTEYSYADLERLVLEQPYMPGLLDDEDDDHDAECGLLCGGPSLIEEAA